MRRNDRGAALIVAMVAILAIAGMATALMNMASLRSKGTNDRMDRFRAFQAAQAAIEIARLKINTILSAEPSTLDEFFGQLDAMDAVDFGDQFDIPGIDIYSLSDGNVSSAGEGNTSYTFSGEAGDAEYFAVVGPTPDSPRVIGGTDTYHFYRVVGAARLVSGRAGTVRDGSERVIEMIVRIKEPVPGDEEGDPYTGEAGLVCGGDTILSGNPDIVGAEGNVHVNGNMTISGNPTISGDLVVSGNINSSGSPSTGSEQQDAPEVPVPVIDPTKLLDNRRDEIDYIFANDGKVYDNNMNVVFDSYSTGGEFTNGWKFNGDPSKPAEENSWDLSGNSTEDGTLYFETNIKVSGNPSHGSGNSKYGITATYITEQSAQFSGTPWVAKGDMGDYFVVAGGDIKASGNGTWGGGGVQGWLLAHEQVYISGNPDFHGAIVAEDAADDAMQEWVKRSDGNFGGGNPYLEYNGGLSTSDFEVPDDNQISGSNAWNIVVWRER